MSLVGKQKTADGGKRWIKRNPLKRAAQVMVNNAVRDGRLLKTPCEACGSASHIQAHHEDYSNPLEVNWLCRSCHVQVHLSRGV
jgi:hypothetical protein